MKARRQHIIKNNFNWKFLIKKVIKIIFYIVCTCKFVIDY